LVNRDAAQSGIEESPHAAKKKSSFKPRTIRCAPMVDSEHLATYLPRRVLRNFAATGAAHYAPRTEQFRGAILFADISGFTDLCERLGRKGASGTEELSAIINGCFGSMLGPVGRSGGDVLMMAGDALVVAWESPSADALRDAVLQAVQCAREIQQSSTGSPGGVNLTVRIGIGAGHADLYYVGVEDHWEMTPEGAPFRQMGVAQSQAVPGEVVVSPEAWQAIQNDATGTPLGEGCVRIESASAPAGSPEIPSRDLAAIDRGMIEAFLPKPVRFLLHDAGEHWMADTRPVTSLFVHLRDRNEAPTLDRMQALTAAIVKAASRFEGTISGSNVDEKGMKFMISFGLPPASHEDDPFRATQAAIAIRNALQATDPEAGYGIATGRVFCGVVGDDVRREYAVIGPTVNLAARLAHQSRAQILCDETTCHAAAARVQFSAEAPLRLKGIPKPIPVFIPTGLTTPTAGAAKMIGHEAEFTRVVRAIADLKAGQSFLGVIEGEAGIGKSTLLLQWSKKAAGEGVRLLRGAAESVHATTPYFVWQGLVSALLGLPEDGPLRERRETLLRVSRGRSWETLSPLLNDILDLGIEDNAITGQMAGKIRADNTRELIASMVADAAAEQPLAIVLEDGHWMDSASLAVAAVIAQRVQPLILLLSTRILTGSKEHTLDPLLALPGAERLHLEPLASDDCIALAAQRLSVRKLAKPIADLIAAKSQGNPFFSVELAFALCEQSFVMIEADECKPIAGLDFSTVKFPDNVQGIIMRRVDSLAPAVQLTAKVASVVGSSFSASLLREAFPIETAESEVTTNLGVLRDERLVVAQDEPEYTFAHAIVEEAIYDRLLVAQRKTLHERVATALEKIRAGTLEAVAPLLGHHWLEAGDGKKAGHYFGLAGLRAVHSGAYQEGLDFLTRALELARSDNPTAEQVLRDAHWQVLRAEAFFGLGRIEDSWKAFREVARLLGQPAPENPQSKDLLQQVARRILSRLTGQRLCPDAEVTRARLLAGSYEMLCLLDLFSNRMASSLSAALESLKQAERLGDSPEYARALATMALASSLVPSRFFAERYASAALKVATRLGHESTTARVREFLGMYLMGEGRWEKTAENFEKAITGFQIVGDRRREIECTCLLSTWTHYRGDFPKRVILGQRVFDLARATGDLQAQAWGLLDQIESLLNLGDFERVRALGDDLKHHLGQSIYGADEIMAYGLLAALEMRIGRFDEALPYAEKALAVMNKVTPTIVYNLEAYAAVAEIYLKGWRLSPAGDPKRAVFIARAREACACTRRFAKIFRIGHARALLMTAVEHELSGEMPEALRLSRNGLDAAKALEMPYEKALAHRQLARLLPSGDRARDGELALAREIFGRLAAKYDLNATDSGQSA
jgi:class 3 adenylate cyclase/tetratricopeptide (TPR) repeat protein